MLLSSLIARIFNAFSMSGSRRREVFFFLSLFLLFLVGIRDGGLME